MSQPLSFLDMFRFGSQSHKVAFNDQVGVFLSEIERRLSRLGLLVLLLMLVLLLLLLRLLILHGRDTI